MHVVGEFQVRHSADRAGVEKIFLAIYRIATVVQLTSLLVFAALLTNAFPATFMNTEFWSPNNYELSLLLHLKTQNCSVLVDGGDVTGFSGLSVNLTSSNVATIWSIHTERIRIAFAVCVVGFVFSAMNREIMGANIFFFSIIKPKLRVHKDIVTTLDLSLEIAGLVLTQACIPTADMITKFLKGCSLKSENSLPFVSLAGLFVSAGVAVGVHCLSIVMVLIVGTQFTKRAEPPSSSQHVTGDATAAGASGDAAASTTTNSGNNAAAARARQEPAAPSAAASSAPAAATVFSAAPATRF